VEPIFGGGQVAANAITVQQFMRGPAEIAPVHVAQVLHARALAREIDESVDRARTAVSDVGATPMYDVHARVEPVPGEGRRGQLFDQRA